MTSIDNIIGKLVKGDKKNSFEKTSIEIKKACNELKIDFEEIDKDMKQLLEKGVISLNRYEKLKIDGKSDKEIIKQIEDEAKLLEKNI